MEQLLGVVLCGGLSKRMGSDKGLLPIGETFWAKKVAGKLTALNIQVVYSINRTQLANYRQHISRSELVIDNVPIEGPLKGLITVHQQFPVRPLLLMACDMLDMDTATITNTIEQYQQCPGYDFYVHQDAEFAQPFCGIYTSPGLAAILVKAADHQITKFSMQHVLNGANTKRFPIENCKAFSNYNEKPNA
ncbi:MAG: molybdenum cofactor guanylyltransferase [Chitinophagaceae bacterium]